MNLLDLICRKKLKNLLLVFACVSFFIVCGIKEQYKSSIMFGYGVLIAYIVISFFDWRSVLKDTHVIPAKIGDNEVVFENDKLSLVYRNLDMLKFSQMVEGKNYIVAASSIKRFTKRVFITERDAASRMFSYRIRFWKILLLWSIISARHIYLDFIAFDIYEADYAICGFLMFYISYRNCFFMKKHNAFIGNVSPEKDCFTLENSESKLKFKTVPANEQLVNKYVIYSFDIIDPNPADNGPVNLSRNSLLGYRNYIFSKNNK